MTHYTLWSLTNLQKHYFPTVTGLYIREIHSPRRSLETLSKTLHLNTVKGLQKNDFKTNLLMKECSENSCEWFSCI